jgi:hypothetical protein
MYDYRKLDGRRLVLSAREYLEKANRYQVKPEELFQYFAQQVLQITVVYQTSSMGKKPLLARSNRPGVKYVVAFTDKEAAEMVRVRQPEFLEMTEEPTLEFLLKAYRSSAEGLMFNPGLDSRFFVARPQLLEWIRYYCIHKFSKQEKVWVIKNGTSILKGSYQPGFSTIVIYSGEEEASKSAVQSGGQAQEVSWEDIFRFLDQIGSKSLYVNYGLPEAFLLTAQQVDQIRNGTKKGYVEQTTSSHTFIPELSNHDITKPVKEELQETAVSISLDSGNHQAVEEKDQEIVKEEAKETMEKETVEDWEKVFSAEEEPLTAGGDIKQTGAFTAVTQPVQQKQVVEEKPMQQEEVVEEKPVQQEQVVEEKPVQQEEVIEEKPLQQEEVIEEKPVQQEQVVEEKPMQQEQVVEEKLVQQEEVVEEKPVQQEEVVEEKPMQQEEVVEEKPVQQKQVSSDFDNPWGEEDDGFAKQIPKTSLFFSSKPSEENNIPTKPVVNQSKPKPVEKKVTQPPVKQVPEEVIPSVQPVVATEVQYGLKALENAIDIGQGMANGWEVCRALADLRRIWVIVDMEGKMVILASQDEQRIADFFTSEENARALIKEAHSRNENLPQMVPRLISTKKLFRALAPMQCVLWINRGSPNAWTSIMGDTLPYVLQLMAQK